MTVRVLPFGGSMQRLNRRVGWVVLAALALPTVAQAEGRKFGPDCVGLRFSTCASVSFQMRGHRVSVDVGNSSKGDRVGERGRSADLEPWEYRPGFIPFGGPKDGAGETNDGRVPCATLGGEPRFVQDCPASTVVTPEPVSMILLATGLAGMAGVGAARRRIRRGSGPQ